ncbi:TPA: hypothetical protein UPZ58_002023 [Listeria monocytogenes]|nr:hypothetical protein [Listeria monocytogenes]
MAISIAALINLVIIAGLYLIKKSRISMIFKGICAVVLCAFSVGMYAYLGVYVGLLG